MSRAWATALALAVLVSAPSPARATFTAFESGQVRPIALSPDGTRLFAVNTPADRLEIFTVGAGGLTPAGSVAVGMEPVAVAARSDTEVWVVNHLSDSISIVDLATSPPRVRRTLLVGDEPRDVVFAGPGKSRAFVTTAHRGQNHPFDPELTTAGTGRADVWVFDAGNLGTTLTGVPLTIVTLFTDTPRALAASPDGTVVYAAGFHTGNRTTTLSAGVVCDGGAAAGPCTIGGVGYPGGLPAPNANVQGTTGPETGLIVRFDGTAWRDELGRNWNNGVRFALPDTDVFVLDAMATPPVPIASRAGVGTILFNLAVNPVSGKVYVSNTEARNEVRFEGPGTLAAAVKPPGEPASVRGHLHEARITVLDGASVLPRHLNKHIDYTVVPSSAATKAKSLATPLEMAVSSDGTTLYVAAFGSSAIGVFATAELENDTFVPDADTHLTVTGGGPTGLVLDEARSQLYVLTRFDNAISVLSTATGAELAHVALRDVEPASLSAGRRFLYDATLTSSNGEAACASCHVFGDLDSLAWDLGNPDELVLDNQNPLLPGLPGNPDFHPMKGPMTTQSLRGMAGQGPMHWRGDRNGGLAAPSVQPDSGAFDEVAAFSKFNPAFTGLLGRSTELSAAEMQAFTDFILQVSYPPNPIRNLDDSLTADQLAGRNFYFNSDPSDAIGTCNFCHVLNPAAGFFGGDGRSVIEPQTVEVPHLRNAYQKVGMFGMPLVTGLVGVNPGDNGFKGDQIRGFGFTHSGEFDTLFRFFNATGFNQSGFNAGGFPLTPAGTVLRRQVEDFVLAFDSNLKPIVGQQVTLTSTSGADAQARVDLLVQQADAGACDLIVKARLLGEQRGLWRSGGLFHSDRQSDPTVSDALLRSAATGAGQELTYTCVPPGAGERLGVDRDDDGFYDRDELDAGTDPADPASVPVDCTSGLVIAKASFKVSKNLDPAGDERLTLRGEWAVGAVPVDPVANGLVLRVDDAGGGMIFSRVVPPGAPAAKGAPGWTPNGGGTKWTFKDRDGATAGGIVKVVVTNRSAKSPGLHAFTVSGKAADFQVAPGEAPVGMQVILGPAAGHCAVRQFNDAAGPAPSCRPSGNGAGLACK